MNHIRIVKYCKKYIKYFHNIEIYKNENQYFINNFINNFNYKEGKRKREYKNNNNKNKKSKIDNFKFKFDFKEFNLTKIYDNLINIDINIFDLYYLNSYVIRYIIYN